MSESTQNFNLISVQEKDGKQLVDARELHSFLEIKKDFSDWIKYQIKKWGFTEQVDFTPILGRIDGKGKNAIDYVLTMDTAKELSMVSRTEKGRQARKYFIEVEKKYVGAVAKPQITMGEETSKLFNTVLASVSQYSSTAAQTVGIKMLEAYGVQVPYSAHPLVVEERWSATEIGKELGVSNIKVGKIANSLGLKRMPFAERRLSSVPGNSNKQVTMYYYNQRAKEKIAAQLTAEDPEIDSILDIFK